MIERTKATQYFVLCLAVAATILSQMPTLHGNRFYSVFYSILWVLVFGLAIISEKILVINVRIAKMLIAVIVWAIVIMGGMIFNNKGYMSNETTTLFLTLFICLNGYFVGNIMTEARIRRLIIVYIVCTFIVAVSVFNTFYRGVGFTWQNDMKNSFSPILLVAIILLLFYNWDKTNRIMNFARLIVAMLMLFMIFLIRSRATLVCVFVMIAVTVLYREIKLKYKFFIILLCIGFALTLLLSDAFFDLIIRQILLTGRNRLDLNSLSSGRSNDILNYFPEFKENWLFGLGTIYLDCFYVLSLYQYGVFGGLLVVGIAMTPLCYIKKQSRKIPMYYKLIVICFSVNGLFEGLTPIGPGVKCMLMWLLFGIFNRQSDLRIKEGQEII